MSTRLAEQSFGEWRVGKSVRYGGAGLYALWSCPPAAISVIAAVALPRAKASNRLDLALVLLVMGLVALFGFRCAWRHYTARVTITTRGLRLDGILHDRYFSLDQIDRFEAAPRCGYGGYWRGVVYMRPAKRGALSVHLWPLDTSQVRDKQNVGPKVAEVAPKADALNAALARAREAARAEART